MNIIKNLLLYHHTLKKTSFFLFSLSLPSMELHKANLEAQSQAAAILSNPQTTQPHFTQLSTSTPIVAASVPQTPIIPNSTGSTIPLTAAALPAYQQIVAIQQQQMALKNLLLNSASNNQTAFPYLKPTTPVFAGGPVNANSNPFLAIAMQQQQQATAVNVHATAASAPHPTSYHVTPKLKAAAGVITNSASASAVSRGSDKFAPY